MATTGPRSVDEILAYISNEDIVVYLDITSFSNYAQFLQNILDQCVSENITSLSGIYNVILCQLYN